MTSPRRVALALALALVVACGGSTHRPDAGERDDAGGSIDSGLRDDAGGGDAGGGDAGAGGDAGTTTDAGVALDAGDDPCGYVDTIDRSCTADADCVARLHQTDCCGSSAMIGIRTSAESVYRASEPACQASYPECGCPAMLPTTDSGETVTDTAAVRAACVGRGPTSVCLTYVTMRPMDGV